MNQEDYFNWVEQYTGIRPDLTKVSYEALRAIDATFTHGRTNAQALAAYMIAANEQPCTVRAIMYRLVSAKLYGSTTEINKVSRLVRILRQEDLLPYEWIIDPTRERSRLTCWHNPKAFFADLATIYRKDPWASQDEHVEVITEKNSMMGVLSPVTDRFRVWCSYIRGHASTTFIKQVADSWLEIRKPIHVYYLGDFDPSGLSIADSFHDRVQKYTGEIFTWTRLSVTLEEFASSPYKIDLKAEDTSLFNYQYYLRKQGYSQFANKGVEVDSINTNDVRAGLTAAIEQHIDPAKWEEALQQEQLEQAKIASAIKRIRL